MLSKIASAVVLVAVSAVAVAACSAPSAEKSEVVDETTQEFGLGDTKIAGSLAYGQTSPLTQYRYAPKSRYVAYKFSGSEGDEIDVWVRSQNGDPVTWILNNDWQIVAKNDDASSGNTNSHVAVKLKANPSKTHYVVVRDYWLDNMSFRVELKGKAGDLVSGCDVDADCAKIEKGCCPLGNWMPIRKDKVDDYQASLSCDPNPICPAMMPPPDHSMPQCNFLTHKCELVEPKDIECLAFSANPHECPPNWTCQLPDGIADAPGKCRQNCGGFGGFTCSDPNEECVDNPNDSCDPNNGGADCGGICVPKGTTPPPPNCGTTGCPAGQSCSFCWGSLQCIPEGAMC